MVALFSVDHMPMPRFTHTLESTRLVAAKYNTRFEFQKGYGGAYNAAYRNNWLDDICAHMSSGRYVYTLDSLKDVASAYTTRSEFRASEPSAYTAAWNNGWLDDVCSHMPEKPCNSFEDVTESALKCKTRSQFYHEYKSHYQTAWRNGWLDQLCGHMSQSHTGDFNSVYIWGMPQTDIFKIGVTSQRLGDTRIQSVASSLNVTPVVVIHEVTPRARDVERILFDEFTDQVDLGEFNGSTEFRVIDNIDKAVNLVRVHS